MSCVGSSNSLPVLAKAAENAGYTMEVTGANEAYIALLKRLVQSDRDAVMKAAKKLQKAAAKAGQEQTREAALQILLAAEEPAKVSKMVIAAMKDPSKNYRNAALSYASGFADKDARPRNLSNMTLSRIWKFVSIFLPSRSCWSSSVMLTLT